MNLQRKREIDDVNLLVRFIMLFRRNFLEKLQTIHFWNPQWMKKKKNDVSNFFDVGYGGHLGFQNGRLEIHILSYFRF